MIPKFRAWISEADTMANDLKGIDFENETVVLRKLYYEDGFPVETEVFEVEIGNAILMQSTGLRDMNNREIFEGDIVLVLDSPYTVFYDDERGSYRLKPHDDRWNVDYMSNFSHGGNFEVIGNIYENKKQL
nr:MAG TPA: YopX protein [Caudoviricetes sp.]